MCGCARTRSLRPTSPSSPMAKPATCMPSTDSSRRRRHRSTWNISSPRTRLTRLPSRSRARELPRQHASVAIRHHAVERARIVVEHQRQELAVAFPHRQVVQAVAWYPLQRAFGIAFERGAGEAGDEEDEAEPVLALLAETGPADRAAQRQVDAVDAGFLVDLSAHAGEHILVRLDLAAQAVVLAELVVVGARVAMDHQHFASIRGQHVTERG